MYYWLHAGVRSARAISAASLYPSHPLQAIAVSECISIVGPFCDEIFVSKLFGHIFAAAYAPKFTGHILGKLASTKKKYEQAEIILTLLFLLFSIFYKSI